MAEIHYPEIDCMECGDSVVYMNRAMKEKFINAHKREHGRDTPFSVSTPKMGEEVDRTLLGQQSRKHSEIMERYLIENICDVGQSWDEIKTYAYSLWCKAMKVRGEEHRIGKSECTIICAECGKTDTIRDVENDDRV